MITIVQLARAVKALVAFLARHPLATLTAAVLVLAGYRFGWPGPVILTAAIAAVLAVWWWRWRASFRRHVLGRVRGKWRRWHYRRHWAAVMTIGRLAPVYQGRLLLPVMGKVTSTPFTDRVLTGIVSGQSAEDFARRAEALAHGFGALLCRVRSARPGWLVLEFVRRDALAAIIIPALPIPIHVDLKALAIGRREDGSLWLVRLHGTHLLVAGATGAGKASIIWGLIRAIFPALRAGLVRLLGADPKRMELSYGREIFDAHGTYAADPADIAAMLAQAVSRDAGPRRGAGRQAARSHAHDRVPVRGDHRGRGRVPDRLPPRQGTQASGSRPTWPPSPPRAAPWGTAWSPRCKTRARKSCRSATCSPTGSRCGWTSPSRWTWCSATGPRDRGAYRGADLV